MEVEVLEVDGVEVTEEEEAMEDSAAGPCPVDPEPLFTPDPFIVEVAVAVSIPMGSVWA